MKGNLLLTIDIGNTETTIGVFDGEDLKATWYTATVIHRTADEYAILLTSLLNNRNIKASDIKEVSLCSVVPPVTSIYEDMFKSNFDVSLLVVAAGIKTGVRICMDNPKEVGADRIVDAVAAHRLYGGPVIIVDFGTATTFDTVSARGDYLGGAIAPGMITAAEAMSQETAMLPRIEMARPGRVIGTNTIDAMKSGIVFGYVAMVEGMVARIQRELGVRTKVVATGGYAGLIAGETKVIDEVKPDLTLIGLRLVYQMNRD
ncbi:MAG TPA: type III pantothenate kinase [Dehalococcoidia bacterium]|nr:type III pantothenate kinase [Dehalococcoidia bacterium]